jgi:ATP adenylyltransferase
MTEAPPASYREMLVLVAQREALVCLNKYPFAASHLLVVSRRHVAEPSDLDEGEFAAYMRLVRESTVRLRRAVGCEAMNVGWNLGRAAGAGIADHLHAHIVPRWAGDTNFMPVLGGARVIPEYLDDSWKRLYPFFADLAGVRAPAEVAAS